MRLFSTSVISLQRGMKMEDFEFNMIVFAMEIAYMVLTGKCGDDACERVLEELDISDDEAGCLEQNISAWLELEGAE